MMLSALRPWVFAASAAGVAAAGGVGYWAFNANAPVAPANPPAVAALASKAAPAPPPASASPLQRPSFDVVRVEPTGDAVVAGRAAPGAVVALLDRGEKIGEVKADANGQFAFIPPTLPPGDHLLTLRATGPAGDIASEQSVAAVVPKQLSGPVVAALTAPGKPTQLLTGGGKTTPGSAVAIRSAEAGEEGSFFASGVSPPGATVRLYLNGGAIADVDSDADGKWSVKINRGMTPGHYDIRADMVEAKGGKVIARAEAPFDYPKPTPAAQAALNARSPSAAAEETSRPGLAVVGDIQSLTVVRGDSLWRISRRILGQGIRYTQIYEANASQIRDPNMIFPGQIFVAPRTVVE